MFSNVGNKIKVLAKVLTWVGIIFSLIIGIALILTGIVSGGSEGTASFASGITIIIIGPVSSWLSALCLYGFGELIVKATEIAKNTEKKISDIS